MERPQFVALGLEVDEILRQAFEADGITLPTKVQEQAIPAILEGRPVMVVRRTTLVGQTGRRGAI